MKTEIIKSVPVTIGGEQRYLKFDINAHIAFHESTGISLVDAMSAMAASINKAQADGETPKIPSFKVFRDFLWAGLRAETLDEEGNETERTLTRHQIGSILDMGTMLHLFLNQVGEAFSVGMKGLPENPAQAPGKPNGRNQSRPTGRGSGASRIRNLVSKRNAISSV